MAARLKDHYDVLSIGKDGNVAVDLKKWLWIFYLVNSLGSGKNVAD